MTRLRRIAAALALGLAPLAFLLLAVAPNGPTW